MHDTVCVCVCQSYPHASSVLDTISALMSRNAEEGSSRIKSKDKILGNISKSTLLFFQYYSIRRVSEVSHTHLQYRIVMETYLYLQLCGLAWSSQVQVLWRHAGIFPANFFFFCRHFILHVPLYGSLHVTCTMVQKCDIFALFEQFFGQNSTMVRNWRQIPIQKIIRDMKRHEPDLIELVLIPKNEK